MLWRNPVGPRRTDRWQVADYVASNPRAAALNPRQRGIVNLALMIATRPADLTDDDRQRARAARLSDNEIGDVGAITALFAMPTGWRI